LKTFRVYFNLDQKICNNKRIAFENNKAEMNKLGWEYDSRKKMNDEHNYVFYRLDDMFINDVVIKEGSLDGSDRDVINRATQCELLLFLVIWSQIYFLILDNNSF
jgi:hypothetical protein